MVKRRVVDPAPPCRATTHGAPLLECRAQALAFVLTCCPSSISDAHADRRERNVRHMRRVLATLAFALGSFWAAKQAMDTWTVLGLYCLRDPCLHPPGRGGGEGREEEGPRRCGVAGCQACLRA
jgi:hypothetical protein